MDMKLREFHAAGISAALVRGFSAEEIEIFLGVITV
jgi:hypothetical protein